MQGALKCNGRCRQMFNGRPCYECHVPNEECCSYALDLGDAQCAPCAALGVDCKSKPKLRLELNSASTS